MKTVIDIAAGTLGGEFAEKDRLLAEKTAENERLRQRIRLLEKALFLLCQFNFHLETERSP